jgi:sugar phosphate isomerase/epimerase
VFNNVSIGVCWYSVLADWRKGLMPISRFMEFSADCGADGVELLDAFLYEPGTVRDHLPSREVVDNLVHSCLEAKERIGQKVHAVSVTNDFDFDDSSRLLVERQKIELGIEIALRVGASTVRVFAGNPKTPDAEELVRYRTIDALKSLSGQGVELALENHGPVFSTPTKLNSILAPVSKADVGTCFDIGNFLLAGVDSVSAAVSTEVVGSLVPKLIHVKDFVQSDLGSYTDVRGNKFAGTFLGQGEVPIQRTLIELAKVVGNHPICIDLELECGEQGQEATRQGVLWLKSLIAEIQSVA